MKKVPGYVILLNLLFGLIFFSCDQDAQLAALQQAEDATLSRDSLENTLVQTMDDINKNLELIREKQGLIASTNTTENISKKEEILRNISLINSLIENNQKKIDELTILTRKLGKEKNVLSRIADQMRMRIKKQEEEITDLKSQLQQESYKLAELSQRMDSMQMNNEVMASERTLLEEGNAELDRNLYMGYFTYGTINELKEKQLVEKKGGFLGVGKKNALARAFFKNKSYFTEIDIRETKSIPVHGKKPKVITFHPEGSYSWENTEDNKEYSKLIIKDTEAFWSTSKFLVVEVK